MTDDDIRTTVRALRGTPRRAGEHAADRGALRRSSRPRARRGRARGPLPAARSRLEPRPGWRRTADVPVPGLRGLPHRRAGRRGRRRRGLQGVGPHARAPRSPPRSCARRRGRSPDFADVLREARALAGCSDPRIVQVYAIRADADPPVLFMEFVDGFELWRVGPSLEFSQRARVVREVADALDGAHRAGVTHRDLKPSNIMLDARLSPEDSRFRPERPRSGDGALPRDAALPRARAARPVAPDRRAHRRLRARRRAVRAAVRRAAVRRTDRRGDVRRHPRRRAAAARGDRAPRCRSRCRRSRSRRWSGIRRTATQSAREMALDLDRFLAGRPVLARPTHLRVGARRPRAPAPRAGRRVGAAAPGLPARGVRAARRVPRARTPRGRLDRREPLALVLADRALPRRVPPDVRQPLLLRGPPVLRGRAGPRASVRRARAAVRRPEPRGAPPARGAITRRSRWPSTSAAISLLPLFLLIAFHETNLFVVSAGAPGQFFTDGSVSNRQLQLTILAAVGWAAWLALRTRTTALSTTFAVLAGLFTLALLTDAGLRAWIDDGRFDRLAAHLLPLVLVYAALGETGERSGRTWLARPLFLAAAIVFVVSLELVSLDGRAFEHLHLSLQRFQSPEVSTPRLLDTVAAMSLAGMGFYAAGLLLDAARLRREGPRGLAPVLHLAVRRARAARLAGGNRRVRARLRLGVPRARAHHPAPQPRPAAPQLLLRGDPQHRHRPLVDCRPPAMVRQAVVGHGAHPGRAWRFSPGASASP